ncbi:DUF6998 domain-containing protein [Paenarthrobacter sp. NCHU4564]|uniref:DUF6998 domain-containing protein n=1 Tax=Paenarthrobacter sp. NCHU4564 TaxID=3451353 RepID=UPI003F97330D
MIDQVAPLASHTNHELLSLPHTVQTELKSRGIIRTSDVVGGVGEHISQRMYGGALSPVGTRAYDLIDAAGRRVQVKTRTANRSEGQLKITFKTLDGFDTCLMLLLAPDTLKPLLAREVCHMDLAEMKAVKKDLFVRDFRFIGIDVLGRAYAAWEALGSSI